MSQPKKIAIFRFSSMGDVALTVPVLKAVITQNPDVQFTMVTPKLYHPFFQLKGLALFDADIYGEHSGMNGLWKLYNQLSPQKFDAVADLHNVLRTQVLRGFFMMNKTRVEIIDKGRDEKRNLTKKSNRKLFQLEHTTERYADVFRKLGLEVKLDHLLKNQLDGLSIAEEKQNAIGIAPFAKHKEKMYSIEKSKEIAHYFAEKGVKVYLFGSVHDQEKLIDWQIENVEIVAGEMSIQQELQLLAQLKVVMSMDSANMHLASIVGVPVISVWGATHPFAGFLGYGQSMNDVVMIDSLDCRPCSVYGNKKCYRGDWACMNQIQESTIIQKIEKYL